jgi:hypothetical protein
LPSAVKRELAEASVPLVGLENVKVELVSDAVE